MTPGPIGINSATYVGFTATGSIWAVSYTHLDVYKRQPEQILIKASNGASDFGNKFGQPLICGSVLTFEHKENDEVYG